MAALTDDIKNKLGKQLTNRLGLALEQGEIDPSSAATVCDMVLAAFETLTSQEDVMKLLQKLSEKWPCFSDIFSDQTSKHDAMQSIDSLFANRNVQLIGSSAGR